MKKGDHEWLQLGALEVNWTEETGSGCEEELYRHLCLGPVLEMQLKYLE